MSNDRTTARPYARAVFELAKENGQFEKWSDILVNLSAVVSDAQMQAVLDNPSITRDKKSSIIKEVGNDWMDDAAEKLVAELTRNGRLQALPAITEIYETLRREAEGILIANVVSAQSLNDDQQKKLKTSLKARLGRDITLNCEVDESLIGGAVIRAGDYVIDGSVKGRIEKLKSEMAN